MFIDASSVFQMATQVLKSGNPVWSAYRSLPGFAASAYFKGAGHISLGWHPV